MKRWLIVLVALVLLFLASRFFYTVPENHYAVVTQFKKIVSVEDSAGLKVMIPFIQNKTLITKAVQIYDIAPSDVITKDKKSMLADSYILWRVVTSSKYLQTLNASRYSAMDRAEVAVYNATKEAISSMTQEEVIDARGEQMTTTVTQKANQNVSGYGIEIVKAEIKALDLPSDNKSAVYERMISERENIAASYRAQGQAEAQKIKNQTDHDVEVTVAEARKSAEVLEAEGEAQYMRTLQSAYNTPEKADFYNFARSLDALKASLSGENKTIVLDKESELARILYGRF